MSIIKISLMRFDFVFGRRLERVTFFGFRGGLRQVLHLESGTRLDWFYLVAMIFV